MAGPVTFNYANFVARYPEFASVDPTLAQLYFNEATIYCRNDGTHPASTDAILSVMLNALTAHIAQRYAIINGQAPSPLVGRIGSASEGSVSVSTDLPGLPGSAAWFAQTKYGLDYWQMTAPYRTMQYRPGPRRVFSPWPFR